jgi:hypothetical protein
MSKQYDLTELKLGDIIEANKTRFRVTDLDLEDETRPVELTLKSTDLPSPVPKGLFLANPDNPQVFTFTAPNES